MDKAWSVRELVAKPKFFTLFLLTRNSKDERIKKDYVGWKFLTPASPVDFAFGLDDFLVH